MVDAIENYRVVIYVTCPTSDHEAKLPHIIEGRALCCDAPMKYFDGVEFKVLANDTHLKDLVSNLKAEGFLLLGARPAM